MQWRYLCTKRSCREKKRLLDEIYLHKTLIFRTFTIHSSPSNVVSNKHAQLSTCFLAIQICKAHVSLEKFDLWGHLPYNSAAYLWHQMTKLTVCYLLHQINFIIYLLNQIWSLGTPLTLIYVLNRQCFVKILLFWDNKSSSSCRTISVQLLFDSIYCELILAKQKA